MEYWARQDLEKLADTILLDCFKDDYEKAHTPTNIDFLTERYLGLNVSYMRLSEDGSILGLTTYADVNVEFNRYGQNEIVAVRKDSVILEKDLLTGHNGRRRFTVAHEAAHQIVFRADRSGTAQMNYLKHLPNKQSYSLRELHGAEDWCEWQANTLGAALLMPARTVHFWMYRFNGNKPLVRYGRRFNYMDRGVLDNLINVLSVSRTALVIRLTQLGYICQRPESEYCDPLDVFPDPGEVF